MRVASDLAQAVGNTPLIKLKAVSEATGCEILGKAEFMNPGQSVKDRAALSIIQHAVAAGDLKPGGTIVEGTAGNTGIGLALVGASMGFKTVIVIPETQSEEKKDMLRLAGAELVQVPAAPYRNPNNFVRYSERLAPRDLGADRRQGGRLHLRGRLGRHAGGRRHGAAAQGRENRHRRSGRGRAVQLLHHRRDRHGGRLDRRRDRAGAVAREMGPGHTIVTILCDYGTRYQSKLFNPEFLRSKDLPVPHWLDRAPAQIPSVFEQV